MQIGSISFQKLNFFYILLTICWWIPCLHPSWEVHIWIEICASLNHRKKIKADGSWLILRKHTKTLVLLSVITYIRTKLRPSMLSSTLAKIWDIQGKKCNVHLQVFTDIDFSLIPKPTILWSWIMVPMMWRQSYLCNRCIYLVSHGIMNEWNIVFSRTKYFSAHQLNLFWFSCTIHLLD